MVSKGKRAQTRPASASNGAAAEPNPGDGSESSVTQDLCNFNLQGPRLK